MTWVGVELKNGPLMEVAAVLICQEIQAQGRSEIVQKINVKSMRDVQFTSIRKKTA